MKLKGKTTIQLFDAKTGKEVKKITDENMLTDALDLLYNDLPLKMGNPVLGKCGISNLNMFPVNETALGGIQIFSDNITENSAHIYESIANNPVGYAAKTAKPTGSTDTRRGNLNTTQSREITNGYRWVYEFGTSEANGDWNAVCLTSDLGGQTAFNGETFLSSPVSSIPYTGAWIDFSGGFCDILDDGTFIEAVSYGGYVYYAKNHRGFSDIPLAQDVDASIAFEQESQVQLTGFSGRYHHIATDGTYLYVFQVETDVLRVARIDLSDDSVMIKTFATTGITNADTIVRQLVVNGIIFYVTSSALFVCDWNAPASIKKIEGAFTLGRIGYITGVGVYTSAGLIDINQSIANMELIPSISAPSEASVLKVYGVWAICWTGTYMSGNFSLRYISPYLATINNLESTVQKNAQNTAIVTYELTKEE